MSPVQQPYNDLAFLVPQIDYAEDLPSAIKTALPGSTVFALDGICKNCIFDDELLQICRDKQLKVYCEMPFADPFKRSRIADGERLVVMDDSTGLSIGSIIAIHRIQTVFNTGFSGKPLLAVSRVAGYRSLAFPMSEKYTPVWFEHPSYQDFIISLIPLSNCITNRCTPLADCRTIFQTLFNRFKLDITLPEFKSNTSALYKADEKLPDGELNHTIKRAFDFLEKSILYKNASVLSVAEGFASQITGGGRQPWRKMERSDCTFETAGAFAVAAILQNNPHYGKIAETLFQRIADDPANRATDPRDPCYGQFTFYENVATYYASGNSKSAMLMLSALPLAENRLEREKIIMRLMYSLLRSTGRNGLHRPELSVPDSFREHNWDYYAQEDYVNNTPHREAALLAMFACGWHWTKDEEFLRKARSGIKSIMSAYPDLPWTNGYSAELAKLPLVLSLLIESDPDGKELYTAWLNDVVYDIEKRTDQYGALLETFHIMDNGLYPPPASHDDYGSAEAPLISENGDPCCDLLYTQIFALAGLHEAFMATGDERYKRLRDKFTDFLIRTQIKSTQHPEFNGGWMRAFDTQLWEYYGSSSDKFWGAWCFESGWTNAPAAMNLQMIAAERSLFSLLPPAGSGQKLFADIRSSMQEVYPLDKNMPDAARAILGDEDLD